MTTKTIYIHIGLEKTGTTSIQNFLYHNSTKLQLKSLFYSTLLGVNQTSLSIYSGQDIHINSLAPKEQEKRNIRKKLPTKIKNIIKEFEKSDCQNLVFSNEHLSSRLKNTNDINKLKELFDQYDYPVKIIMYVRNQVDLLESIYFEGIKAGDKNSLIDCAIKFEYFELDFIKMLEKWESVFGEESIIVRLFDRRVLKNKDVIDDFFSLLSVKKNENEKFIFPKNQNISLGYKSIEFMRLYNLNTNVDDRKTYQLNSLLSTYKNDNQKASLSDDDRNIIFNKYSKSNHDFLKKYLPEISYDTFINNSREHHRQDFSEEMLWDIINHLVNEAVRFKRKKPVQTKEQNPNIEEIVNNRWYLFGQMSNKRKVWTIAKVVSKKIKLYWLLQQVKNIFGK